MKKMSRVLAALAVLASVLFVAPLAAWYTQGHTVTMVGRESNGSVYVYLTPASSGCAAVYFPASLVNNKEIFSAALAAYLSGSKVRVDATSCTAGYGFYLHK